MKSDYTPYDPKETEQRIYALWEASGFFNPEKLPGARKEPFVIMLPPPNITGSLHMGHALEHSLSDALIRWKRMQGFKTLWLPGTDHAGIATQNVVEKELKKEGLSRHTLGREKFLERVWEWKEKYGSTIIEQMKKLGASLDWSRLRFTMDAKYQEAVKKAFLYYYEKGLLYQGERTVNWCTRCGTSLSDLELEYTEENGTLYHITYGPLTLATVRPETKLGDTGIAVHPDDERYKKYIGKEIEIESVEGKAKMKVIADERVDPLFGTGVIKVTPAHDILDFDIGAKNNLPIRSVIGPNGKMNENAGPYKGMKVEEARRKIVEDMRKKGLLVKEEPYVHRVARCYRCGTIIEPMPSMQWFLKMNDPKHSLANTARDIVKKGRMKITPKKWERVYINWLENIKDWNISRQIWWGHKIPLEGVDDVLDTWFSSALWPFATLGWPEKTKDLKTFYPTTFMTSGRDILHLWITRMIFSGIEFTGAEPFHEVYIHPTIQTKTGKRMSKSLGTGVDPLELIEKYGADATRFGLLWQVLGGQDIRFGEEHIIAGKKFANKVWNAGRFIEQSLGAGTTYQLQWPFENETELDRTMKKELSALLRHTNEQLAAYEFGPTLHALYDFFWKRFADVYIEDVKKRKSEEALRRALFIYATMLKLLHPFMPFVTEAMYDRLPIEKKTLLLAAPWPEAKEI